MKNIYAYTESVIESPAFISINEGTDGFIYITVRSRGNGGKDMGTIHLTKERYLDMIEGMPLVLTEGEQQ